jgi:glycosyltransferase involved in cell wall biosynthesis
MKFPKVSFLIPTLNAEDRLPACLTSIRLQDYPKDKYEILIVDGGSTDSTLYIAKLFGARVINNPRKDAESGKSIGIEKSKGNVLALLDSDNVITKKDWLKKMTKPLIDNLELFGVESNYFSKGSENLFNKYTISIHIADPFARSLASKLKERKRKDYIEYTIPNKGAYPLGANGFLWRKSIINKIGFFKPKFEESNFSFFATEAGYRKFARVPGYGIYHYHVGSIFDFIKKRLKIGNKFLDRKIERKRTWIDAVPKTRFLFSVIYCATFIGPTIESLKNIAITKRGEWILHPFMSFLSVCCYGVVYVKRFVLTLNN